MTLRRTALFMAAAMALSVGASARLADAGDEDIRFLARGPAGIRINGKGSGLEANEQDGKLYIRVSLRNLETGIALRDKHLRQYLDVKRFPEAVLEVDRKQLQLPSDGGTVRSKASGRFTLHGVSKPLRFDYKARRTGSDHHVEGIAKIDIADHGVEQPCYLGVCVETKVKIRVKFKLRDG